MGLSAKEAAESVGITKQGIIKSIREGKISAQKNNKGQWVIEPVELYRVYTPINQEITPVYPNINDNHQPETKVDSKSLSSLQHKVELLQKDLLHKEELLKEKEKRYEETKQREEDLSKKLDHLQATLHSQTVLLTDMRDQNVDKKRKKFLGIF